LEDTRRLATLRDQIDLFDGETVFEGWAAERIGRVDRQPGLALLTSWRLIVADMSGGFSAIPITKIDRIDLLSSTTVRVTAWYETISLDFESAAAVAALVNGLGQDPRGQVAVAGDGGPANPTRPVSTLAPAPPRPAAEPADQCLLMGKPSL
jgi:hypothetical protein